MTRNKLISQIHLCNIRGIINKNKPLIDFAGTSFHWLLCPAHRITKATEKLSSLSWVYPGAFSRQEMPRTLHHLGGVLIRWPNSSTGSFQCGGVAAVVFHPILKEEPRHPSGKANFSYLYVKSQSFGHYPQLILHLNRLLEHPRHC